MTPASYSLATISPASQSLEHKPSSRGREHRRTSCNIGSSECCSELQTQETWQEGEESLMKVCLGGGLMQPLWFLLPQTSIHI